MVRFASKSGGRCLRFPASFRACCRPQPPSGGRRRRPGWPTWRCRHRRGRWGGLWWRGPWQESGRSRNRLVRWRGPWQENGRSRNRLVRWRSPCSPTPRRSHRPLEGVHAHRAGFDTAHLQRGMAFCANRVLACSVLYRFKSGAWRDKRALARRTRVVLLPRHVVVQSNGIS